MVRDTVLRWPRAPPTGRTTSHAESQAGGRWWEIGTAVNPLPTQGIFSADASGLWVCDVSLRGAAEPN
jgi:hypothetical protein